MIRIGFPELFLCQFRTVKNSENFIVMSQVTKDIFERMRAGYPFHTNFGRFIQIGRNVFINHSCSFLDLGGITIEDDVKIGPRVNLISESHLLDPSD